MRIAVVVSQFNKGISERLLKGALRALHAAKFPKKNVDVFKVPGAFEIPFYIQRLISTKKYSGFIALGAVIKGETDHYRAVCDGVTFGLQKVSIENRVPVMFGVLMCGTRRKALERAGSDERNKGFECGKALIEMLNGK